jgi:ribulose-phosphate 3-epimerase
VPNLTWGAPVVAALRKHSDAYFDVHLMVSKPSQWVDDIASAGGNMYTFHLEAVEGDELGVEALCAKIRAKGMKVGISIKPGTPVEALAPYVALVDLVLIMTVEPGFGGQSFMPAMLDKVRALRTAHPDLDIQVDGGLGPATVDAAAQAGANSIVAGSAVFKPGQDPRLPIAQLRRAVEKYGQGRADDALTPLPAV